MRSDVPHFDLANLRVKSCCVSAKFRRNKKYTDFSYISRYEVCFQADKT